jgi:hypothetical protein
LPTVAAIVINPTHDCLLGSQPHRNHFLKLKKKTEGVKIAGTLFPHLATRALLVNCPLCCWRPLMRFIGVVTSAIAALVYSSGLALDLPAYLSEYRKFSCAELAREGREISKRGFLILGLAAGSGGSDGSPTAPAIVIVWPTSSTPVDGERSASLALAIKQMEALEQASIESQCSIRFQRLPTK